MLARSKLNSIESKIFEASINNETIMKTSEQLLMKKKSKKALEWWKLKELILKKMMWLKKVKEKAFIKSLDKMHKCKTMISYCLKFKKNRESINTRVSKINNKTMLLSKCAICGCKKSRFMKKQEANGLLSSLGIKAPLSKILLLGYFFVLNAISLTAFSRNAISLNAISLNDLIVIITIL